MLHQDYLPTRITAQSPANWINLTNLLTADGNSARNLAYDNSPFYMEFWTQTFSGNPLIPPDSLITGLEIFYTASLSFATPPTNTIKFGYYINNTRVSPVTGYWTSVALTASSVTGSVGGPNDTLGLDLQWVDLNSFLNGRPIGNPWFGIYTQASSAIDNQLLIDYMFLRIYYTTSASTLVGSRSMFHADRPDLGYDVIMNNGVASTSSYLPSQADGLAISNQVASNEVNMIGDALYNIENSMLSSSGSVFALDLKKTYVFSITVSAICTAPTSSTVALWFELVSYNGVLYQNLKENISNVSNSVVPHVPDTINCYWVDAIAWTETLGVTRPLYAYAPAVRFARLTNGFDINLTVSAVGSSIGTSVDVDDNNGSYSTYNGCQFTAATAPVSGKVWFKVLALGRES